MTTKKAGQNFFPPLLFVLVRSEIRDPGSEIGGIRDPGSGMEENQNHLWYKHPVSPTMLKPVFRIRDILVGYGSESVPGSSDPSLSLRDPDPAPDPILFISDLQDAFNFFFL